MHKRLWIQGAGLLVVGLFLLQPSLTLAQAVDTGTSTANASNTAAVTAASSSASTTASNIINQQMAAELSTKNVTAPEELSEKTAIISLFESRPVDRIGFLSFMAYWVQQAVQIGIPANTIYLILLTPFLATLVSFTRVVIGLPTLDMLVPIALAFAFLSVGVSVGLLLLAAILLASYVSKKLTNYLRIMFYPKRSLSMFFLAIFVFAALTLAVLLDSERVLSLSIFPVLILMLLGDSIVSVQLHKSAAETFAITTTTLGLGLLGFVFASSTIILNTLILYPELVLLTIPLNIMIGRYFGLRFFELFRFGTVTD